MDQADFFFAGAGTCGRSTLAMSSAALCSMSLSAGRKPYWTLLRAPSSFGAKRA